MRASRLLAILIQLQVRGRVSAAELARQFEVSVRTLYRDIDALSASGVPIYTETGRNGGVQLLDGYRTRLTGLNPAEANALPFAGQARAAQDLGIGGEASLARTKMLASLPAASGANAVHILERFHVDPLPWYHRYEDSACLRELADAVWNNRRISMRYESWKGAVSRTVDPLGLVQKAGIWYLVAAVRKKPRSYRVSNIQKLKLLDGPAKTPKGFNLPLFWDEWVARFERELLTGHATVRLSRVGLELLRAFLPAIACEAENNRRSMQSDGWCETTIPIEEIDYAARQLLRLGSEAEVLEPHELRQAIAKEAARVVALYRESEFF